MTNSASQHSSRIAILGAGLLGRLSAWQLLEAGQQVSLYEAGSFEQSPSAARTAAAMISPLSEVVASEREIYNLGLRSLQIWPEWIQSLNKALPDHPPVQYDATGSVVVAHPQDRTELQQFHRDLEGKLGSKQNSKPLNQSQITKLEPALAHFNEGLYLPDEAYLDNRQLLDNLLQRIRTLGGKCHEHTPIELDDLANNKTIDADTILDCRGMGAKKETSQPLRGVRGEVMWVECPEVKLTHPVRLMHPRYKLYVVPKGNDRYIIGATEIESEDLSNISLQSSMELSSALYTLNPAFAEARIIETDVNLRPAFMDNLPHTAEYKIGDTNVIQINGLYRHGYLLAPAVLEQTLNKFSKTETTHDQLS